MKRIVAVLLTISLTGVGPVVASPLVTASHLRLDDLVGQSAVEKITNPNSQPAVHNDDVNRQINAKAPNEIGHAQPIEDQENAGVSYPATESVSFGFTYSLEETEDLIEDPNQSRSISEDYENHTVLLRANWHFN